MVDEHRNAPALVEFHRVSEFERIVEPLQNLAVALAFGFVLAAGHDVPVELGNVAVAFVRHAAD